jgi:hypothetical protein
MEYKGSRPLHELGNLFTYFKENVPISYSANETYSSRWKTGFTMFLCFVSQGVPDPGLPDEPEAVPAGQAEVLSEGGQLWVHALHIIAKKELWQEELSFLLSWN